VKQTEDFTYEKSPAKATLKAGEFVRVDDQARIILI